MTTSTPRAHTSYRVRAHTTPDGTARIQAADQTVPVDTAWDRPPSGHPGPAELLAAALAACRKRSRPSRRRADRRSATDHLTTTRGHESASLRATP
ncbi:hypothetical protein [Streptomyces europaeiscabiei]|uniref:hypothetical protein n=1 Tax=Streptomyces europaeiscabiei TaxID=146819 RepID=UPI002E115D15|nr:hypothetical protein OHB30_22900 [Streptomyces europaeiscabiei]